MASITIKAIIPKTKQLVDQRKLDRELRSALGKTGDIIRSDFRKTTRTWSNKPSFQKRGPKTFRGALEIEIFTENLIYFFLTRGTRKNYPIPKGGPGLLRFRAGYRAKTRVRTIGSRAGGSFGPIQFARRVTHPGIEARDFDKVIAKRRIKTLDGLLRLALLRSVKR